MNESFLDQLYQDSLSPDSNKLFSSLKHSHGRYSELSMLTQGGMKLIYTAYDSFTERRVVIAVPKDNCNEKELDLFIREAYINAFLQHPGITQVYDLGILEDYGAFFSMKLMEGEDLNRIIQEKYNQLEFFVDLFIKVLEAVAYAHSKGIIHRDIKPENIRVDEFNEVLLCDWGLAQIYNSTSMEHSSIYDSKIVKLLQDSKPKDKNKLRGSRSFIAPELFKNPLINNPQVDIYSLGAVLYNLITGRQVHQVTCHSDLKRVINPKDLVPSLPEGLTAICMKALSFRVDDRYSSVKEMISEVIRYRNGFATQAEKASSFRLLSLLYRRNKMIFNVLIMLFFLVVIFVVKINESRNLALIEKERALNAEAKALNAEKQTNDLFEELKIKEQNTRAQSSELYYEYALNKLEQMRFDQALDLLQNSLDLNQHNKRSKQLAGLIHFACFNQEDAGNYLRNSHDFKEVYEFIKKADFNNIDTLSKIVDICNEKCSRSIYYQSLLSALGCAKFNLPEKVNFYKKQIYLLNKQKNIRVYIHKDKAHLRGLNISLARHTDLGELNLLNINNLNLNKGSLRDFKSLNECDSIRSLSINCPEIISIKGLSLPKLKELKLKGSRILSLHGILQFSSLEILDLSATEVKNFELLKNMPNLKVLFLDKKWEKNFNESQFGFKIFYQ